MSTSGEYYRNIALTGHQDGQATGGRVVHYQTRQQEALQGLRRCLTDTSRAMNDLASHMRQIARKHSKDHKDRACPWTDGEASHIPQ
jgi:hypothetical protein